MPYLVFEGRRLKFLHEDGKQREAQRHKDDERNHASHSSRRH